MIEHPLRICPECGLVNGNGYMTCPVCGHDVKTEPYKIAYSDLDR
jgi:uncharacterized Zn finger protein (UPF0148 family)